MHLGDGGGIYEDIISVMMMVMLMTNARIKTTLQNYPGLLNYTLNSDGNFCLFIGYILFIFRITIISMQINTQIVSMSFVASIISGKRLLHVFKRRTGGGICEVHWPFVSKFPWRSISIIPWYFYYKLIRNSRAQCPFDTSYTGIIVIHIIIKSFVIQQINL